MGFFAALAIRDRCDRDQPLLPPPYLRDWLPENHLAWFVIEAVERLDLELLYGAY